MRVPLLLTLSSLLLLLGTTHAQTASVNASVAFLDVPGTTSAPDVELLVQTPLADLGAAELTAALSAEGLFLTGIPIRDGWALFLTAPFGLTVPTSGAVYFVTVGPSYALADTDSGFGASAAFGAVLPVTETAGAFAAVKVYDYDTSAADFFGNALLQLGLSFVLR